MYRTSRTIRLLSNARDGSRNGLGDLLESYRPLLAQMACDQLSPRLRCRMSESDLVQETMLTASRTFGRFRGTTECEFRAWLVRVFQSRLTDGMRQHLIAECRRSDRERFDGIDQVFDDADSASTVAVAEEDSRMLLQAIMDLDPQDRQIVLLRYVQQLAFQEIADQMSMPLARVWRRWNSALEQLRRRVSTPTSSAEA